MRRKIGIITTFYEVESGYSLVAVTETQIKMLLAHNYDPVVLVRSDFEVPENPESIWRPEIIDLRPVLPTFGGGSGTEGEVEKSTCRVLEDALAEVDVVIDHDLSLQPHYRPYWLALRRYSKKVEKMLFLHWIHSRPTGWRNPGNPPGFIIYPNAVDRNQVSLAYQIPISRVRYCRAAHAVDPLAIGYSRLTRDLAEAADLASGDITAVYPARLDRGKQPEKIIRLMAGVKNCGYDPRLLIIDWQAQGKRFQRYIDELSALAGSLGIGKQVCFTSRLNDQANQGVPRGVVLELMDLTSIYVHPSRVETYSLTTHEAMLKGKLCVLNHDLAATRDLFGDNAIYMDFGSDDVVRHYSPNEQVFWNDEARRLVAEFYDNRALVGQMTARRMWSPQALWPEFERLLYLDYHHD